MRALCLALALCCVSYAAAEIESDIQGKNLEDPVFDTNRDYLATHIGNKVTITTPTFTVTGIPEAGATDDVKGSFFVDDKEDPHHDAETFTFSNNDVEMTKEVTWTQEQLTATYVITYRIYTVAKGEADDVATIKETLATSAPLTIKVLERKDEEPKGENIVLSGCEVAFAIEGIYSKPPLRSFCGFTDSNKDFLDDPTTTSTLQEGEVSFDSNRHDAAGADSKWQEVEFENPDGSTDADYKAWKLTDAKLNVKNTVKDAAIGAKCMVWWDEQNYKEYEGAEQPILVDDKHRCEVNPLKVVADRFPATTKYAVVDQAKNCWTEQEHHIEATMTCKDVLKTGHYTVYCKNGEYVAYTDKIGKDDAKAWDDVLATTWAQDTCGTDAAADITAEDLNESDLEFIGRNYYLANRENTIVVETVEFTVEGATDSDVVKGAFYVGGKKHTAEDTLQNGAAFTAEASLTVDSADVGSAITYKVFKEGAEGDVLAQSAVSTPEVLDLKDSEPNSPLSTEPNECQVTFNMEGIYSNPPMRSFCGFKQGGKFLDDRSNTGPAEGVVSFDSASAGTKWEQASDQTNSEYKAWKLTDAKLNVKDTDKDADLSAACMIWWDEQSDYKEYEGPEQTIGVDAKHKCDVNPLKAVTLHENFTDTTTYEALANATNCWTDEVHDIEAKMTCTGEGKTDNSYTVYCEDGEYMAYKDSKENAEKWAQSKAEAWADTTCGTAGILPMSLLVGALALLASRA